MKRCHPSIFALKSVIFPLFMFESPHSSILAVRVYFTMFIVL